MVILYVYDATGRQTGEEITAGALTQSRLSEYDVAGRLYSETVDGLTTWHSYSNGGLTHQTTAPNGTTQITKSFLDGQMESVTGTGVVSQYYNHSIQTTGDQLGYKTTTVRTGRVDSPRYEITTQDLLGRTVEIKRPGTEGTQVVQKSYYNDAGQLTRVTQTGMADQVTTYNEVGEVYRSGLDMDGDGLLTPASMDRFTETETKYESIAYKWYRVTTTRQYLVDNQATTAVTVQKEALGGGFLSRSPLIPMGKSLEWRLP